jgi:hypothetical protein
MLMAADMRAALDPSTIGAAVGITLDPWQADLISERPHRALMCCSRQSGKTLTALLLSLWTAIYQAPSLILIVSPSQRQSGEAFRSFMALLNRLDRPPAIKAESALRVELDSGSRVIALPGSERTIRGYSGASLIVLDEAARIESNLIQAITPMLAVVDGSLIALSTPFGRQGWFATTWLDDSRDWRRVRVPASECPRLSKDFLASEMKALGPLAYSEEYELAFVDDVLAMFPSTIIDRAFSSEVKALWA